MMPTRASKIPLSVIAIAAALLIAGKLPASADERSLNAIIKGREFLAGLFDEDLQLLPEYRGAKVYWLFHDNYLAAKVLEKSHPVIGEKLRKAIGREKVSVSGKIEILFGEAAKPLPFREFNLVDVRRIGTKAIRTEVAGDVPLTGWAEYADLLFLASVAAQNQVDATKQWNAAMELWDGNGFRDAAWRADQRYSTYKLALALIAGARCGASSKTLATITAKLLSLQDASGGWITDYDRHGNGLGVANVETTCLAILGLEQTRAAHSIKKKSD
jgi:hypothetical protein